LTQNSEIKKVEKVDSNILLDDDRSLLKPSQQSEQYHLSLNQKQAQNAEANATFAKQHNFKTLAIQTNQEGKISLKKYSESTDPDSLFQWKGNTKVLDGQNSINISNHSSKYFCILKKVFSIESRN